MRTLCQELDMAIKLSRFLSTMKPDKMVAEFKNITKLIGKIVGKSVHC